VAEGPDQELDGRWTYNACNAAVRARLCRPVVEELRALFLDNEAFGRAPKKNNAKRKKIIESLSRDERQRWADVLEPTNHLPGPERSWVLDTPRDIRDKAVKELVQAYSTPTARSRSGCARTTGSSCGLCRACPR